MLGVRGHSNIELSRLPIKRAAFLGPLCRRNLRCGPRMEAAVSGHLSQGGTVHSALALENLIRGHIGLYLGFSRLTKTKWGQETSGGTGRHSLPRRLSWVCCGAHRLGAGPAWRGSASLSWWPVVLLEADGEQRLVGPCASGCRR